MLGDDAKGKHKLRPFKFSNLAINPLSAMIFCPVA